MAGEIKVLKFSEGVSVSSPLALPTGSLDVEDEGISVSTSVGILNFVGAGVTATEPVAGEVTVTIPGGGGGSVDDTPFGISWDADTTTAASKNALYDKIDAMDTTISANTAKVSNATHTGEVTGSTTLAVDSTAITNKTEVTADGADHFLISDASDAGNLKKALISDVLDNATHTGEVTGSTALTLDKTAITNKTLVTAAGTDHVLIADSSDTDNLKKALVSDFLGAGTDNDAIHDNVAGEIALITEKVTPVAADLLIIEDSAAANAKKRVQIGNLPGGGSSIIVEDEGTPLTTAVTKFNFAGAGVTVTEPVADEMLVTIPGGGGGGWTTSIKTTTYTAASDEEILSDTSGGIWTLTLPASPTLGDRVRVLDATDSWASFNLTINPNGANINGAAANLICDVAGAWVELVYMNVSQGWRTRNG